MGWVIAIPQPIFLGWFITLEPMPRSRVEFSTRTAQH